MRVRRVGERAVLIECTGPDQTRSAYAEAKRRLEATDIVPAVCTVLVDGVDPESVIEEVASWKLPEVAVDDGPLVQLPVSYDGPDLELVARHWNVSSAEVGAIHRGCDFVVAFCGFAPGFAYCSGLPTGLAVPRRDTPRTRVPAGSVALAGSWTGVYPTASPGGWQLIGSTDAVLWRPEDPEPTVLVPGTRVRFVP